ncbi:MAG: DUF523 domain-containing protein [Devosiaceae bacterium]|nr:DUF523 domain-containing protein [Devosiaceae bacterium MH13]
MTAKILVSACLLGQPVRYNGKGLPIESAILRRWIAEGRVVALCPEVSAGFPTPRPPAEISPGAGGREVLEGQARIYEDIGTDVTDGFVRGANNAVRVAQEKGCTYALLTDGSPSCGSTFIYSGQFDGTKTKDIGVVTAALQTAGITVFAQHQIKALDAQLQRTENQGGANTERLA